MKILKFAILMMLGLLFFIPTPSSAYTLQDVQNYLDTHPAPSGCSNWTEEYTSNGQKGVKVWKRCGDWTVASYEVTATGPQDNWGYYGGARFCDGTQNTGAGWPVYKLCDVTSKYTYCNGAVWERHQNSCVSSWTWGIASPCLLEKTVYSDCKNLDTLLTTFFPITNCVDGDYDGFYKYDAVWCSQGNDCDDGNLKINPNTYWYKDADNDGYSDGTTTGPQCQRPAGYKLASELKSMENDCDDTQSQFNPEHPCCDLKINMDKNAVTISPSTGGGIQITGSISDSSNKAVEWEVALPNGKTEKGTGKTISVTWDGKGSDGKVIKPEPGQTMELAASVNAKETDNPDCKDSKSIPIKIEWVKDACMLKVTVGSSANVANGNLSHSQELFSTKGTGLTIYYNSLDSYTGPLGKGWSHNYDMEIGESIDGYVIVREGDGGRRVYTNNGGSYTSQPGDYTALIKNADGTFIITYKEGTRYDYNAIGKIAAIADRNGNAVSFTYNSGNDLASITDSAGRTTSLSYNADHRISTINDLNGNIHSFTYSGSDLISVTTQSSVVSQQSWSYTYYENSFMHTKTDPNGYTTTYTYDEDHRVATSTDPEGNVKSIAYPQADDTSQTKTTTVTEKDGGNWTYTYDTQAGTLTSKTDPENGTASYTYDENRNMTSKTEPDGSVTSYTYDSNGNMALQTDALDQTTTYTYNAYGLVTSITDPQNNTTTYEYDTTGNLTKTTDATGASTSYQYDAKGNVIQIKDAVGQTTSFTYDQQNNLSSITDPTGATISFTYDTAGNMTSQTDASGATTRFEYNSLGRLIKVIDPSGNSTNSTYDNNGNKTSETDANGNTTDYEYNYKGQLIKVKDALGNVTTYTYGGTGCSSCGGGTDKLTVITDANGNTTSYEYDKLGRLIKETDPLGNAISYSYDSKGNLLSKTDANSAVISYSYDSLGRLLKKAYPDNTTESFTYDSKGNILTATNSNTSYTFGYNTSGKVTSVADSNSRTVSYQYDSIGNKTKLTYPEGSTVTYSYDTANRLKSIVNGGGRTYTYSYDSLGRRSKLSLPNGTSANYSYDASGRLIGLIHKASNGSVITQYSYTHDKVGNRLSKTNTDVKNDYSYDAIYRLLQSLPAKLQGKDITQDNKAEAFNYDPVGNRLTGPEAKDGYTYNTANQLTSDRMHQYEYDKNGNLVKRVETEDDGAAKVWTYSYDYENRLNKVVKQEDTKITTVAFRYDPFGRRLEKKVEETKDGKTDTKTYAYVYDNEDIILEYLTKTEDGKTKTEATKYVHGPGIDELLAIERKGEVYFYHADGLGSVTALTDKKQKVIESYTYSSFGEVKRKGDKVKNTYTFTAREWDEEIGLYYVRARYLDPVTGHWTSFDPLLHPANGASKFKGCSQNIGHPTFDKLMKKPQKLNPYNYVEANPIMLKDPTGLGSCGSGKNEPYVPDNYGFYNLTGPCENHDKCYGTCGNSRIMCDLFLFADIMKECSKLTWDPINQVGCIEVAYIYYGFVATFGQKPYNEAQKAACCT
ncbi:MAG: RHS repeat-associated core domain-containing protein [Deltaproteobacteria bacterium]|nr:RHS repeat-associated core domain-containing protein [Deltaproteobacteria bacterium]